MSSSKSSNARSTPVTQSAPSVLGETEIAQLRRMNAFKQTRALKFETLGADLLSFFKKDVQRRQSRFGAIADAWLRLVPSTLVDHTCLDSFQGGTLRVMVDSSAHLYEMKTVLLAGLEKQLLMACKSAGLRKITMKLGRWYDGDDTAQRKVRFD